MGEFIAIQVGQCGNQIGSSLWPAILREYGIPITSHHNDLNNKTDVVVASSNSELQNSMSSFFHIPTTINNNHNKLSPNNGYSSLKDLHSNKIKARVLCIDMEDSVVSRFKTGRLRHLFDGRSLITDYPGSGNNWARGHCEHGPQHKSAILQAVQRAVERCDNLQGFLLLFSAGGGTGSGLGTYVLKLLADYYSAVERFAVCVYPIGTEDVVTCPYNMILATHELLEHATCVFPVENRALLGILARHHRRSTAVNKGRSNRQTINTSMMMVYDDNRPYEDMNNIIVNMLLHLTSGSRFPGALNFDMNELNTNMVPFPKLNFISSGFCQATIDVKQSKLFGRQLKDEMFLSSCNRHNQLLNLDPFDPHGVVFSTILLGRGNYTISDMRGYVDKLRAKLHFTAWSRKAMKVGMCGVPPAGVTTSMFTLFNTSSMANLFQNVLDQYVKLYTKKAHVHHYTNVSGFELHCFQDCETMLRQTIENYEEIQKSKISNTPRLLNSNL